MKFFVTALALLGASPAAAGELPAWLAGSWEAVEGERWFEESWTRPRAGIMLGLARAGSGEALRQWEMFRIAPDETGKLAYFAQPEGRPAVVFRVTDVQARAITFTNPAHDYPQRIRYWRVGDELLAETALADGGRARVWRFARR